MGYGDIDELEEFRDVISQMRQCALKELDLTKTFANQDSKMLERYKKLVCANVPVVNDYPNCWPHMAYAKLLLTQDNYAKTCRESAMETSSTETVSNNSGRDAARRHAKKTSSRRRRVTINDSPIAKVVRTQRSRVSVTPPRQKRPADTSDVRRGGLRDDSEPLSSRPLPEHPANTSDVRRGGLGDDSELSSRPLPAATTSRVAGSSESVHPIPQSREDARDGDLHAVNEFLSSLVMPMPHILPIFLDLGVKSHQKLIAVARGVPDLDGLFREYLNRKEMDK
ncbi:hypothetical protein K466DRAFT_607868, partial [Polyporus arcularius HHB13444]